MASRRRTSPRKTSVRQRAIENGYRSGLEEAVGGQLQARGIPYLYEEVKIPFLQPAKPRTYKPDFILPNGIIIETKGQFVTGDRQKHLMILDEHPDLDIRFVFTSSRTKISKQSKTTYALWCESHGFSFADKEIPSGWLREKPNRRSIDCLIRILGKADAAKALAHFNII